MATFPSPITHIWFAFRSKFHALSLNERTELQMRTPILPELRLRAVNDRKSETLWWLLDLISPPPALPDTQRRKWMSKECPQNRPSADITLHYRILRQQSHRRFSFPPFLQWVKLGSCCFACCSAGWQDQDVKAGWWFPLGPFLRNSFALAPHEVIWMTEQQNRDSQRWIQVKTSVDFLH